MPKTRKDFEFAIAHAFAYALTVSGGIVHSNYSESCQKCLDEYMKENNFKYSAKELRVGF